MESFESWGVLELMGHVRIAGRITEEERFGSKLGRIDIPKEAPCEPCDGTGGMNDSRDCPECKGTGRVDGFTTQFFNGSSIYRLTPCSEDAARAVAKSCQPEPVHQWELPKAALPAPMSGPTSRVDVDRYAEEDEYDDEDDTE